MSVQLQKILNALEQLAPLRLAEDWDNPGLQTGNRARDIQRVLLCLDVTPSVVEEAINQRTDLIISHHPLIFKELKHITQEEPTGRLISKLIKHDINVYSAHTNLDVAAGGVNQCLAERLGLIELRDLNSYKEEAVYKLVVYVPAESLEKVRDAICSAGAGWIGNYSDCTFSTEGTGTFRPLEGTNPYLGSLNKLEQVREYRLETVVKSEDLQKVMDAMRRVHPYEEIAYDVFPLKIKGTAYGLGKVGFVKEPLSLQAFIENIKERLNTKMVRVIGDLTHEIRKAAVFCGSFDGDFSGMQRELPDILVTGDIKYHTAREILDRGFCVVDAGHFSTEAVILPKLKEFLLSEFPDLLVSCNSMEDDPFKFC